MDRGEGRSEIKEEDGAAVRGTFAEAFPPGRLRPVQPEKKLGEKNSEKKPGEEISQPTNRFNASRYFSAVFSITSRGRRGAGAVLSQGWPLTLAVSSQSRRYCLS